MADTTTGQTIQMMVQRLVEAGIARIEWLETLEDTQIARAAFAELKAAGGDRKKAGWVERV